MSDRTLTVTLQPDWRVAVRAAGKRARADRYQGEVLNFVRHMAVNRDVDVRPPVP